MPVYSKKSGQITIVDIAREVGVSHATVSRVLNGRPGVRASTRADILAAVDRLGYTVNLQARRLAGGKSQVIGLIISGLTHGYSSSILAGIEEALGQTDYDLLLYSSHSRLRRQQHESHYVERLTNGMADGLIILTPFFPRAYLDTLKARRFPCVLIDHHEPGADRATIHVTNWVGAYEATEYLIRLGHERIGFIGGWEQHPSSGERLDGYRAALEHYGLPYQPEWVTKGDFLYRGGYQAARILLRQNELPTAIFAASDEMAIGTIEAAREIGLEVPRDLSVIGFDDIPQASVAYPKLTTVSQSLNEIGRLGVETLLHAIENPQTYQPQQIEIPTRLIIRESCQPPGGQSVPLRSSQADNLNLL